jgi:hypothetical protein
LRLVTGRVVHLPDPRDRSQARDLLRGEHDCEAVRHEPVAPADARVGKFARELGAERALLGGDSRRAPRGVGQRGRLERDHHLDAAGAQRLVDEARALRAEGENRQRDGEEGCESGHREVRRTTGGD